MRALKMYIMYMISIIASGVPLHKQQGGTEKEFPPLNSLEFQIVRESI